MKKSLFSLLLLSSLSVFAQHTEFYAGVNGGVLSFRGKSAINSSFIIRTTFGTGNYTNNIYSRKSGIGIGVDFGIQRVTKSKFIYGIATGLELLKHRVEINDVSGMSGTVTAKGDINFHSRFINIKPAAGYRFPINKKILLDLTASLEIAVGLSYLDEVGIATITGSGEIVEVDNGRGEVPTDVRTGLQAKINMTRYSFLLGYWIGQTNYDKGYVGGSPEAYSNLFRVGLCYRFNKLK